MFKNWEGTGSSRIGAVFIKNIPGGDSTIPGMSMGERQGEVGREMAML